MEGFLRRFELYVSREIGRVCGIGDRCVFVGRFVFSAGVINFLYSNFI